MLKDYQVFGHINRLPLGQPLHAHCILQIEIVFETVGRLVLWEAVLRQLDAEKFIAYAEVRCLSSQCHDLLGVNRSPDEEAPRFESAAYVS